VPQKLSPYKVSKMMALYFSGYSESAIAHRLKIDQSTVSLYVSKFKTLVEQQGLKVAGQEFGIMHEVEELHSLAVELKKSKSTIEEAKLGLNTVQSLQGLGIKQEEYLDVIQGCAKAKSEGYLADAVKLSKLEKSTGMTHGELVAQYVSTHEQLEKDQQALHIATGKLKATVEELAAKEKQKKVASEDLAKYLKQLALDMNRLKSVEGLAITLKEASVSNKELENYIERQQALNKAGISLETFVAMVEKTKVLTSHDQGKGLLEKLSHCGGLDGTITALQAKVQLLEKQTADLEKQAQIKGEIESDIAKLKSVKAGLEGEVAQLNDQKIKFAHLQSDMASLTKEKAKLEQDIAEREAYKQALGEDIKAREREVSDLEELQSERAALIEDNSQTKAKLDKDNVRLEICESLFGLIEATSFTELEKFAQELPHTLDLVKQGNHSPQLLRNIIMNKLGVDTLQLLKCGHCHARFATDKLASSGGPYCPSCGFPYAVVVEQDVKAILRAAQNALQPKLIFIERKITTPGEPKPKDNTAS